MFFLFLSVSQAWASVESGVIRAFASYCMFRFQRSKNARCSPHCSFLVHSWNEVSKHIELNKLNQCLTGIILRGGGGHQGMQRIKNIIFAKLKAPIFVRGLHPDVRIGVSWWEFVLAGFD